MIREATGAIKPVPGEITYNPFKPTRREGRVIGLILWFCRVLFAARGPRVSVDTWSSLHPLVLREGTSQPSSGTTCRENAIACAMIECSEITGLSAFGSRDAAYNLLSSAMPETG
jgi:hypothetical protein